jgi:uncharacterized phage-like protein YoqJ
LIGEEEIIQYAGNYDKGKKLYVVNKPKKICCFTGHRPRKLSFGYNENHPDCIRLKEVLKQQIEQAVKDGYSYFILGGALGVDQWAAEIILEFKRKYPHIRLEIAVPCRDQDKKWKEPSKKRYRNILSLADVVCYVSLEDYHPGLMIERDDYMIGKSQRLIAVFNGRQGGTEHTVKAGREKGLELVIINPDTFEVKKESSQKKILECSSKGDKRFSSFYALVTVFGKRSSIEHHYQMAKRFGEEEPKSWKDAKGRVPSHFEVNGWAYPVEDLDGWYKYLWLIYLDGHPELVEYARKFDGFRDSFAGKNTVNNQADVIRQYVKEGRESILIELEERFPEWVLEIPL